MSLTEAHEITRVTGAVADTNGRNILGAPQCSFLTSAGRCDIYEQRPMICRLWGVAEAMRCDHGCEPEGGPISDLDGVRLLLRTFQAGGHPALDARAVQNMSAALEDPGIAELVLAVVRTRSVADRLDAGVRLQVALTARTRDRSKS